ncbi:hypothetical protein GW17_00040614 [Ensete ventricosum]|nr:hypothetical protein GW17_00040614 [Ensete ventricosum]
MVVVLKERQRMAPLAVFAEKWSRGYGWTDRWQLHRLAATVVAAYVGEMGKTAKGSTVGSNGRPCRGGVGGGRRQRQWLTRALDATVIVRVGNQWLYAGGATAEEGQRGPVGWSC